MQKNKFRVENTIAALQGWHLFFLFKSQYVSDLANHGLIAPLFN